MSILEVLQDANINLECYTDTKTALLPLATDFVNNAFTKVQAKKQLNNVIILLEKGYDINSNFNSIIDKYGSVEKAPDRVNGIFFKNKKKGK
ncbi:MAG: hypothetical protein H8E13_17485 [Actinobacteria bacterium]|nr:hypothetical protein [Actinomycetota bacterium]